MKILLYDVETRPTSAFVWSAWKQNVAASQVQEHGRVICWAAKWLGDPDSKTKFGAEWEDTKEDFIQTLWDLMAEADAVITYNGNKFDEPVVRTEYARRGLTPCPPNKSIDLYQVVRKQFRLLHNRMDSVAEFLGIPGKVSTGGFQLWVDVMDGDPSARKKMKKYNIQDIRVLEGIYHALLPWIHNHPSLSHYSTDTDLYSCPRCGSVHVQKRGEYKTKVSTFQRYHCQDCGSWSRARLADKEARKPELVII